MKIGLIVVLILVCVVIAVYIFHKVHHYMYCRYRGVPGKSHCAVCGHREVCKKVHHKGEEEKK